MIEEILNNIDPAVLDYLDWLNVGMAIQHEGLPCSVWDEWSQSDTARYTPDGCGKKWNSFVGSGHPVTGATITKLAKDQGWTPAPKRESKELAWDAEIGGDYKVVDKNWVQGEEVKEPANWEPAKQLTRYLSTLFQSEEHVGYVCESWLNKDTGKNLPKKGCYDRTAGKLIHELQGCKDDIGAVLGDYKQDVGAWIRFNPFDGKGIKDGNVTSYRYTLVESDELPVAKQAAIIKELELPVAILVHSGGRSLHAIVRIEATDYTQYRERVDFLYKVCQKNGLNIDTQNRNPSRLSRMPGVIRKGKKQFIVDSDFGKKSWDEWKEYIEDLNDDLPDIKEWAWDKEPELDNELIKGILREGHKMLLSGPSKAGKSFALLQLCTAIASGGKWFGHPVKQGKVLYINLELSAKSATHRIWKIHEELGIKNNSDMIDVWQLRGHAMPLDKLTPKLIRRSLKKQYKMIVIDPIYKLLTGDENSASEMATFCNQFDKISNELGCAVVYCHHHSKGEQGHKTSQDRASGSGVFARDPDAILDLIELNISKDTRDKIRAAWTLEGVSEEASEYVTGWRLEATLREFKPLKKQNYFYRYPLHIEDTDNLLAKTYASGETKPKESKEDRNMERYESLRTAYDCSRDFFGASRCTVNNLAVHMGLTERTIQRRVKEHPDFRLNAGIVEEV